MTRGVSEHRFGCRWCPTRYQYFRDLSDHVNDEHPVEYERAITRPNLAAVTPARYDTPSPPSSS